MDNHLLAGIFVLFALIAVVILLQKPRKRPKPEPPRPTPVPPPPCPCPSFIPDSNDPKPLNCRSCSDDKLSSVYRHWLFENNAACLSDPHHPQCRTLNHRFSNELMSGSLLTGRDTLYGDGVHRDCGCLNG
jgi:hypothetical protein